LWEGFHSFDRSSKAAMDASLSDVQIKGERSLKTNRVLPILFLTAETLTAVVKCFNRDVARLSTAVRKLEERLQNNEGFKQKIDAIQRNIKL